LFGGTTSGSILQISLRSLLRLFETDAAHEEILREVAVDRVILAMPDVPAELLLVAALLRLELHMKLLLFAFKLLLLYSVSSGSGICSSVE